MWLVTHVDGWGWWGDLSVVVPERNGCAEQDEQKRKTAQQDLFVVVVVVVVGSLDAFSQDPLLELL